MKYTWRLVHIKFGDKLTPLNGQYCTSSYEAAYYDVKTHNNLKILPIRSSNRWCDDDELDWVTQGYHHKGDFLATIDTWQCLPEESSEEWGEYSL